MQNTKINFEPVALGTSAANILNGAITSLSGPVGLTLGQPYLLITHIRVTNKTNVAVSCTLYKGATGASVAGTEFAFAAAQVPPNQSLDWYAGAGGAKFASTDFLTGIAGAATSLTVTIEGEVGFATA